MDISRPLDTGTLGAVQWASASCIKLSSVDALNNSGVNTVHDTPPRSAGRVCERDAVSGESPQASTLLAADKVFPAISKDFKVEERALKLLLGKQHVVHLLAVGYVEPPDQQQQQRRLLPCLVLQLSRGTPDDYGRCSEAQARRWTRQLLQGLMGSRSFTGVSNP